MCGFVGFVGRYNEDDLKNATLSIAHRGPDSHGSFISDDKFCGLGFRRLAIQDLSSSGNQPMKDDSGDTVMVFNGEIYNVHELRNQLVKNGYFFEGSSDTEVVLKSYLHFGDKFVDKLNGIFAIAIYLGKQKKILLYRDKFGVKPLYVFQSDQGIVFGSEPKSFLPLTGPFKVNTNSIPKYSSFLWCPDKEKIAENLSLMEPGEMIEISAEGELSSNIWFDSRKLFNAKKFTDKSPHLFNETKQKLRQAVHRQMISDVPLGAFLSGGLDSTSVVAFAKELNPNIECFTINQVGGVDQGETDDLYYAKIAADHLNVNLNILDISEHDLIDNIETMIWMLDEPLADPAALNVYFISQFARKKGIKVLLSGAGGDDIFTGYRRHFALNLFQRLYVHKFIPKIIAKSLYENISPATPFGRRMQKLLNPLSKPNNELLSNFYSWTSKETINSLLISEQDLNDQIFNSFNSFIEPLVKKELIDQSLALELRYFLSDHNLIYTDKMSMAAGVEVRVPFLDEDLVKFALRVPNNLKHSLFHGKWVLKKSMEGILPKDIIFRPKAGFTNPLRRWVKFDLEPLFNKYLSKEFMDEVNIFNFEATQNLIHENKKGNIDASYTIFSILCIHIWIKKFC